MGEGEGESVSLIVGVYFYSQARVFVFLTGFRRNVPFTSESALETAACNSGGRCRDHSLICTGHP